MTTVNLRDLDGDLYRRAKLAAAEAGETLKAWIEGAMLARLGDRATSHRPKVEPPASAPPLQQRKRRPRQTPATGGEPAEDRKDAPNTTAKLCSHRLLFHPGCTDATG